MCGGEKAKLFATVGFIGENFCTCQPVNINIKSCFRLSRNGLWYFHRRETNRLPCLSKSVTRFDVPFKTSNQFQSRLTPVRRRLGTSTVAQTDSACTNGRICHKCYSNYRNENANRANALRLPPST